MSYDIPLQMVYFVVCYLHAGLILARGSDDSLSNSGTMLVCVQLLIVIELDYNYLTYHYVLVIQS